MQSFVFATDCERVREFECAVRKLAHYLRDFEVRIVVCIHLLFIKLRKSIITTYMYQCIHI